MRYQRFITAGLLLAVLSGSAWAQRASERVDEINKPILAVFAQQERDWNRGDLEAFTSAYEKSPDIVFLGPDLVVGYSNILRNFQHIFPTRASMGQLNISGIEVQPVDTRYATATAHIHLRRGMQNGGDADGYFMVLFAKSSDGWKIVRDASTLMPSKLR